MWRIQEMPTQIPVLVFRYGGFSNGKIAVLRFLSMAKLHFTFDGKNTNRIWKAPADFPQTKEVFHEKDAWFFHRVAHL
jgi:hypothetical protein